MMFLVMTFEPSKQDVILPPILKLIYHKKYYYIVEKIQLFFIDKLKRTDVQVAHHLSATTTGRG
jgi:hypothetical protein